MMDWIIETDISVWHVVFWHKNPNKVSWRHPEFWQDWWAFGGYRHVSAFGYSPGAGTWVHFDAVPEGFKLRLIADGPAVDPVIATFFQCGDVIRVPVKTYSDSRVKFVFRGPFTCVTIIKHLLGLRCSALTPASLRKYILRTEPEVLTDVVQ